MLYDRKTAPIILIRGGGDLASGVALRLFRVGFRVLITELAEPLVVRRMASFAQAIFDTSYKFEEVTGVLVTDAGSALKAMAEDRLPVMIDPDMDCISFLELYAMIDGRMLKSKTDAYLSTAPRVIGLGPGFTAGVNCHAVVETNRGPFLGRVYWQGSAEEDSGVPESVRGFDVQRVLYAPADGTLQALANIGDQLQENDPIARVNGRLVTARFKGVLRGLIHDGLMVSEGLKIGDLDPRCDPRLCTLASDKSLAIGGGVLEALFALSTPGGRA